MSELSHIDQNGNASMVDVSDKLPSVRTARAAGKIVLNPAIWDTLQNNPKGDVFAAARIAGIMAAKNTWQAIPLCHLLMLSKVSVDFILHEDTYEIEAISYVKCTGTTGVEMEALSAVSTALLTLYDMLKAAGKGMVISDIRLLEKTGGKSKDYIVNL